MAGFAFGVSPRRSAPADASATDGTTDLAEHLAGLLASLSFLVFGAVLLGPTPEDLDWWFITYAVLSLTVIRMLPVALALAGSRMALPTVACIGWRTRGRRCRALVHGTVGQRRATEDSWAPTWAGTQVRRRTGDASEEAKVRGARLVGHKPSALPAARRIGDGEPAPHGRGLPEGRQLRRKYRQMARALLTG
ncbi:hypothetical protein [Streptomyces sp. NPDC059994]|uniref:hypothetical protein n=1 Tax=Streptomyces sp. NPDC059994 TaxID=3347029 RepID=UPI00368D266C